VTETARLIFARRLREQRRAAGMSQAELGRRMSEQLDTTLDGSAVTRIEKMERAVKLEEAVAAAGVLGVPLQALLVDEPYEVVRLRELRQDLARQENRAAAAKDEMRQATAAMMHIEQEIELLQASRDN